MIKIIDNLLTESYLKDLQNYFLSQQCDWNYNDNLTYGDSQPHLVLGSFGFTIRLHWNQVFMGSYPGTLSKALIFSALDKVQEVTEIPYQVVRARADMTVYNSLNHRHELHTDYPYEHMTGIFYLNTSDGNTLLFDREGKKLLKEVDPIENRLLIFDGLMQHTGHSPSNHKSRVLINMNFMTPMLVHELNNEHRNNEMQNY
jgi:hypothetical protein